jgi:hypothetical protein
MARRLFLLVVGVAALAIGVAGPAGADGGSNGVTITATESLSGGASTFVATGGIFGASTSGAFSSDLTAKGSTGHSTHTLVRGTDTLTYGGSTLTLDFVAVCVPASQTMLVCDGAWHATSDGDHGGGSLHSELDIAAGIGTDTFTGTVVQN